MVKIPIELGKDSYSILIGSRLSADIEKLLETFKNEGRKVVILTDENVRKAEVGFLDIFTHHGYPIKVLEAGEKNKSLKTVEEIYNFLVENGIRRKSVLFTVGGGVIGDVGGFVAATYMRGIDYYQVPTTFLAMVDSAVGGKTGINLPVAKNLVGAFHQPKGVFIDINFLKKLPNREFAAGMAEVIKYGLIADKELFEELETAEVIKDDTEKLINIVRNACQIKAKIVEMDAKDCDGTRNFLNFGHTFGHAIENAAGYGIYSHGEAVSIGMMMAARLSQLLGYLDDGEVKRIERLLKRYELPIRLRSPLKVSELNKAMCLDKKIESGVIHFVVLKEIGKAEKKANSDEKWLHALWNEVGAIN